MYKYNQSHIVDVLVLRFLFGWVSEDKGFN